MQQDKIYIGEIEVPIIIEDGVIYYPISFVMSKVLLKQTGQQGLQKDYSTYMKRLRINYGKDTGGIQNVNCISEEGLIKALGNSNVGRLGVDQKKAMNTLLKYLGEDEINKDNRFVKTIPIEYINKYNLYIRDCIDYVLELEPDVIWQKCTKCEKYYPYHINFFDSNQDGNSEYSLSSICRDCSQWDHNRAKTFIKGNNIVLNHVYNTYGSIMYLIYKNHETIEIFNHWRKIGRNNLPSILKNKEDKLIIIKYMYDIGEFKQHKDLNDELIREVCGFGLGVIKLDELYQYVLGIDYYEYNSIVKDLDGAKLVFDSYIKENNIIIGDIFDLNYYDIFRKCHLGGFVRRCYDNSALDFIMDYYDKQYPAYKFKGGYIKYWSNKKNRIESLRYFIEEDMKIELEKVPLYITLSALRNRGSSTLYTVCKNYYGSLFEWINEVYPERFNPNDFDIHYVRNDFDSIEEAEVHDVLTNTFNNVIYNPHNTDRTIKIEGKIPDWFLFTNTMCYIVEYFGMSRDQKNGSHNSRVDDYKKRMDDKIEKYDKLDRYGKLYIFPDDLKDNFSGLREKLKLIV